MSNSLQLAFDIHPEVEGVYLTPEALMKFGEYWVRQNCLVEVKAALSAGNPGVSTKGVANTLMGLSNNFYIQVCLKQAMLHCVYQGARYISDIQPIAAANKVFGRDVGLLQMMATNPTIVELVATRTQDFTPRNPADLQALMDHLATDTSLSGYLGRFINRKMRFISENSHVDYTDLYRELHNCGVLGVLRKLPTIKDLSHAESLYCNTLKQDGHTLILRYTTGKNGELIRNETTGELTSRKKLIGDYEDGRLPPNLEPSVSISGADDGKTADDFTLTGSLQERLQGLDDNGVRLVNLLMDKPDAEFSEWFAANTKRRRGDAIDPVGDYYDQCLKAGKGNNFINKAAAFLNMSPATTRDLVTEIKTRLEGIV